MSIASVARPSPETRVPRLRSAVTNGKRLHVDVAGDNKWSRRFRDILDQIIADLSGPHGLSESQRQLARRCATLAIQCERLEGSAAAGNEIDISEYSLLTSTLVRVVSRLGIKRVPRDVTTPSVAEYVDHINRQTLHVEDVSP
jgi:hypothetical protein